MLELQETVDVGEVKLNAVLVFVDRPCHGCKADAGSVRTGCFGGEEFGDELGVKRQGVVGKRGIVRCELGQGKSRQRVMVRWSEDEDSLPNWTLGS